MIGKNFIWFHFVDDIFISDLARHRVISGLAAFLSAVTKYLTGSCIREEKFALDRGENIIWKVWAVVGGYLLVSSQIRKSE